MTRRRSSLLVCASVATALPIALVAPAGHASSPSPGSASLLDPSTAASSAAARLPKTNVMTGSGGAVASIDRDASQAGIDVLAAGGNAADAAVATAAALGVTEPFSSGMGGGGFLVYYDAASKKVSTIDGRETAPASFTETVFLKPDGTPKDFWAVVNSGLSVGVPGTPALWDKALRDHGTISLDRALAPAERLARNGFVVDETFHEMTAENAARFSRFPASVAQWLPGGQAPAVGSRMRNPDMARAYALMRTQGVGAFYTGPIAKAIVNEARNPGTAPGAFAAKGQMTLADMASYRAIAREPVHSRFRGLDVYGMPAPSSGGIAVAEILNLMQAFEARTGVATRDLSDVDYYHRFSEASAIAFADRNRYVGDVPGVPTAALTSWGFAYERSCLFDPQKAQARPIPFGSPDGRYGDCTGGGVGQREPYEGESTTHLSVMDRWGNIAAYTLTIEMTGGSGITVPGYGFLLNNELTDFNFSPVTPGVPDPNLPGPGKRPRSSMSPTVILKDGQPFASVGTPGGATIITTVAQIILGHTVRGLPLVEAIAAPRLSSRNGRESAEWTIMASPLANALRAKGHVLSPTESIGAASGIRWFGWGIMQAASETTRHDGGSAMVVRRG